MAKKLTTKFLNTEKKSATFSYHGEDREKPQKLIQKCKTEKNKMIYEVLDLLK